MDQVEKLIDGCQLPDIWRTQSHEQWRHLTSTNGYMEMGGGTSYYTNYHNGYLVLAIVISNLSSCLSSVGCLSVKNKIHGSIS